MDNLSLWRRTQEEFSYDLKKTIFSLLQGDFRRPAKKQVLKDVDLVIYEGEKLGIIGSNGAGKSTLLKVISGILEPTQGQIRVRGSIAPLIELGAGFDAELSLVDNIVMYGVMLGFSRALMKERVDEILNFAELQDYRLAPVKALSSGMTARLGFAIATDVHPDILILDEVLAVGDENFKNKCQRRMDKFWEEHTTVLVVSHSMDFIKQSCDRVVWLDRGKVKFIGAAEEAIQRYFEETLTNSLQP